MKHLAISAVITGLIGLFASNAAALEANAGEAPSQPVLHEPGIYLSAQLGMGYGSFASERAGQNMSLHGLGIGASILCGGTIARNLALVADVRVLRLPSPTLTIGDESMDTPDDVTAALTTIGPSVIYYFMPANVSVGVSAVISRLTLSQDDEIFARTDLGYGAALRVGKEWALRTGALGIVADLSFSSMKDQNDGPRWTAIGLTIGGSATYN